MIKLISMPVFCLKNLEPLTRVGERLKTARENQGLKIEDVAAKTRVPAKYLEAIETARFCDLPQAKAHRLAYVRAYAEALGLNPAVFLYQFSKECDLQNYSPVHPRRGIKLFPLNSLSLLFRTAVTALFVIGFIGYMVWQIKGILEPPKLAVFTPMEGFISSKLSALVQGETEKEVKLTVNEKEIMANDKGRFEAQVDLSNGLNTITITATKKHGKNTTVTRHVIVKAVLTRINANGLDARE